MSTIRSLRAFALLLTFAGCTPPAKAPPAPVDPMALRDAIQAREKEWSAGFLAGNGAAVASLYTEDGAQVQPSGDWARGRAGIQKAIQSQLDTITVTAREDVTEEVFPAGEYVVEIGHYSFQGTSKAGNAPRSGAGRYMEIWQKGADGVWRIYRDIGTEAPAKKP